MSDENVVAMGTGQVSACSTTRLLRDSESWNLELINKIIGTWNAKGKLTVKKWRWVIPDRTRGTRLGVLGNQSTTDPEDFLENSPEERTWCSGCMKCISIIDDFLMTRGILAHVEKEREVDLRRDSAMEMTLRTTDLNGIKLCKRMTT